MVKEGIMPRGTWLPSKLAYKALGASAEIEYMLLGTDMLGLESVREFAEELAKRVIPSADNIKEYLRISRNRDVVKTLSNVMEKYMGRKTEADYMNLEDFIEDASNLIGRLKDIYHHKGVGGLNEDRLDLELMAEFCCDMYRSLPLEEIFKTF